MSRVLGLDSGGTKTLVAVADRSGTVVALHRGAGLDPSADPHWPQALKELLGHSTADVEASVLGLPFHDEVRRYSDEQRAVAQAVLPGNTLVQNDVRIAFDGAMAGAAGVLALAGTGSMAWASLNRPQSPHVRVGGWGDAFGDEGSAFWIGREALALASRHLDGRAVAPDLCDALLSALSLKPDELIGWCYAVANRRTAFADLAVIVSSLAEAGDTNAETILQGAADHLSAHITAAWHQTTPDLPLLWSYAGGVFSNASVLKRITGNVGCDPTLPRLPPVGGALLRAADLAGWAIDDAWVDRLSASLATLFSSHDHQHEGE